jgi:hypothetical protein
MEQNDLLRFHRKTLHITGAVILLVIAVFLEGIAYLSLVQHHWFFAAVNAVIAGLFLGLAWKAVRL